MRIFRDREGTEWTVFEVRRQAGDADRWAYLPLNFGEGWLCFESAVGKRRLPTYPPNWTDLGEPALLRLLRQAQPARVSPRAPGSDPRARPDPDAR